MTPGPKEQGLTEVADVEEIRVAGEGGNVLTHDGNRSQEVLSDSAVILLSLLDLNPKVKIHSMDQACARCAACGVLTVCKAEGLVVEAI